MQQRKNSLRRPDTDYASDGAYFVTICTHQRLHLFGHIADGVMNLSHLGKLAQSCWQEIPAHQAGISLDVYVVMPNHVHGIIILHDGEKRTLGQVIGRYKAAVTRIARREDVGVDLDCPLWQRNYHDRIIRNRDEYAVITNYVMNNPALWEQDTFYD